MTLYFVETTASEQRALLCRWTERFHGEERKVQIVVDSTQSAQYIDQMLWSFSQSSFIPHRIAPPSLKPGGGDSSPSVEPVLIVIGEQRMQRFDVVLCDVPVSFEFMEGFETVVHFILRDDEQRRQESRALWQKVRGLGLNPVHIPYESQKH